MANLPEAQNIYTPYTKLDINIPNLSSEKISSTNTQSTMTIQYSSQDPYSIIGQALCFICKSLGTHLSPKLDNECKHKNELKKKLSSAQSSKCKRYGKRNIVKDSVGGRTRILGYVQICICIMSAFMCGLLGSVLIWDGIPFWIRFLIGATLTLLVTVPEVCFFLK